MTEPQERSGGPGARVASARKPVVLVLVGNYLPGHKAGGIVRTIVNTVDHLCDEFAFKVLTRDRDLGDEQPYANVEMNRWQPVGNAEVWYLPPNACTLANLGRVVGSTPHDVLYLNSFFDPLTVKTLANLKLGRIAPTRVIVAPRGEFAWASLGQKYPKKYAFMLAARLVGLYRPVTWHASSPFEAQDIVNVMKVDPESVHVAFDFPLKTAEGVPPGPLPAVSGTGLRLVYLSRVAREKNLDYALRVLSKVRADVVFDIYGPTADEAYWNECRTLIKRLPANVVVNYRGMVDAADVVRVFSGYDVFLFPTGGEAYGHVIVEALIAGTPVLTSTETPWRGLEADGMGWDFDLAQEASFVEAIDRFAAVSGGARISRRAAVKAGVQRRLADPAIPEAHRRLFKGPALTGVA